MKDEKPVSKDSEQPAKPTEKEMELIVSGFAKKTREKAHAQKIKRAIKGVETVNEKYASDKEFIKSFDEKLGLNSIADIEQYKASQPEAYFLLKKSVSRDKNRILKILE